MCIRTKQAEERDRERRIAQTEIDNSGLDASLKMEAMDLQIAELEQQLKDVSNSGNFSIRFWRQYVALFASIAAIVIIFVQK